MFVPAKQFIHLTRYIFNIDMFYNTFFSHKITVTYPTTISYTRLYEINNKIINSIICTCVHLRINSTFKNSESETISLIKHNF